MFGDCEIKIFGGKYYFYIIDAIKWLSVVTLLMLVIIGSYIYRDCNLFYRIVVCACIISVACYLMVLTSHGQLLVVFARESYSEVRKVVWPTFHESIYTTCIIIVVTFFVSLILWSLDSFLVRIVSFALRL